MINSLLTKAHFFSVLLLPHMAFAGTMSVADTNSKDIIVRYEASKVRSPGCVGSINYADWGDDSGLYINTVVVDWVSSGITRTIPDAYLCGLKDTPQKTHTENLLGLYAWLQLDGTVIIRNYFYPNAESVPCYWVVWPDGRVEFTALPDGGLLSAGLVRKAINYD